ncbi:bile acid:sodium symporter family protein [Teredinibacter waterburyi]|uniref:bile acid:sodium symporter family protein n=1 Tax=Teredinibacter waterburyi TaxID=1500538 RepID=UPI00165F36C1|nr:hypothetical protein [Teredinibacter waterburyi]
MDVLNFTFLKILAPTILALIMVNMGASVRLSHFKDLFVTPKALCLGLTLQILILPLITLLILTFIPINPMLAVGIMILVACPGGPGANALAYVCDGDTALSVALSIMCSFAIGISLPIIVKFSMSHFLNSNSYIDISEAFALSIQVLILMLIPLSLGMVIKKFMPKVATVLEFYAKPVSMGLLVLLIIILLMNLQGSLLTSLFSTAAVVLTLCFSALIISQLVSSNFELPIKQARSIIIGVSFQNAALAFTISLHLSDNPMLAVPAALYTPITLPLSILLIYLFKRQSAAC